MLETNISNKARELAELAKTGKYSTTFVKLGVSPNLDNALTIQISTSEILVVLRLMSVLGLLLLLWWIDWCCHRRSHRLGDSYSETIFFSDHGRGKAKEKVQKELDSCKNKILEDLHIQLNPFFQNWIHIRIPFKALLQTNMRV